MNSERNTELVEGEQAVGVAPPSAAARCTRQRNPVRELKLIVTNAAPEVGEHDQPCYGIPSSGLLARADRGLKRFFARAVRPHDNAVSARDAVDHP